MKTMVQKKQIVDQLRERLLNCEAVMLTDYRGLKVKEMDELRKRCRENGIDYQVVKNTLVSLVAKETPLNQLRPYLIGPTAIGVSHNPVVLAKVFVDFSKEYKEFKLKILTTDGELFDEERIKELATLPNRDILMGHLLFYMKSPIHRLMNLLLLPLIGLLNLLKEVESKKEINLGR